MKAVLDFHIMALKEGREKMQVEIKIDQSCTEPKVMIWTAAVTEEVNRILDRGLRLYF